MNKSVALWLGATLLTGSPCIWAQSVAQPDSLQGQISAFHGNRDTLVQAIRTIERSTDGKVVDIRFSHAHGMTGYHAVIVKHGRVKFFHIEEFSNRAVEIDVNSGPVWMLGWRGRSDVRLAQHAPITLAQAIRTAERSQNEAPAVAAGIARSASNPDSDIHAYTVLLDVDGSVKRVAVDDSSGEVIANPDALTG